MQIPIEISARHVHLSAADFAVLFGEGTALTVTKKLSQPGEFLSAERVDIAGPKRTLKNVAILGPFRAASQVEISATDMRSIGLEAPLRESGDLANSAPCKMIGPAGEIILEQGLIIAKRHIHMTPPEAAALNVADKQIVRVQLSGKRALIFDEVVVRVSDRYSLAMHIDTDEGNAAIGCNFGEIIFRNQAFFEVVAARYSHKEAFLADAVPLPHLERIAEAGLAAPSGANRQSVRLIILPTRNEIQPLCAITSTIGLETAPAAIAVLTDSRTNPGGMSFEMEDYAAAVENMLLAVTALGYVSLWLDSPYFDLEKEEAARKVLGAPDAMTLRAVLPIGLPDGTGSRRTKLPYNERVSYGCFTNI